MSSKDKTGEKLVASVRKSKTGNVARRVSERPKKGERDPKTRTSAAGESQMAADNVPSAEDFKNRVYHDAYRSTRRVWPD